MNSTPLVSVFLPTYNQLNYVSESLESVLQQDYPNLEIVVGDDHSTDGTWERVQEYQQRFPDKIKAFRNPQNLGITGNCNRIIEKCTGKYVVFSAGDDLYLPGKISSQVQLMEASPDVVLSYHDIEAFNSADNSTIRYWNRGESSARPITGSARKVLKAVVENGTEFMAALSVMVKREVIPSSGYDQRVKVASDWLMWMEMLANGGEQGSVAFIPRVLARYRRHDASVCVEEYKHTADEYVTLAIFEDKHPDLARYAARGCAKVRYRLGVRAIKSGKLAAGRALLLLSLRSRWISWRILYWLAATYLPALLRLR